MSAHVLLILLNKLRKRDKMQGLSSILSLFCNEFNTFNNSGAGMLDSIYHMALKLYFWHENLCVCYMHDVISVISQSSPKSCTPLVVYRF